MSVQTLLRTLRSGSHTNRELQAATGYHSTEIARDMNALIRTGRARRIDGRTGRGNRAVYALVRSSD